MLFTTVILPDLASMTSTELKLLPCWWRNRAHLAWLDVESALEGGEEPLSAEQLIKSDWWWRVS